MSRNILLKFLVVTLLLPCGCATIHTTPHLAYNKGVVVETLASTASLSISNGDRRIGSNGYLLYQRPDRLRLVVLSPFGTTMMEAILTGDLITIISNSKGVAYSGNLQQLPHTIQGDTWRKARWLMDTDPPGSFAGKGSQERVNIMGVKELVTFENGLVVSKRLPNGDMVRYQDYILVNGVPLASEIIMDSHDGGSIRIKVKEPEVNGELAPDAFIPHLDGMTVYPLTALQEP